MTDVCASVATLARYADGTSLEPSVSMGTPGVSDADEAGFAINGRFFGQPTTGVQRYAREVVAALDGLLAATGRRGTVMAPRRGGDIPPMRAIDVRREGPAGGHLWEQAVLPARWRGPLLNLCNTAPVVRAAQVVCIHDANVFRTPDSYGRGFRTLYRTLQPLLARRSSRIATVSRDAARQLAHHLPVKADAVAVLPNGHEHALRWDARRATVFAGKAQERPFVLLLGSRARHKNAALVLDLAGELDALGLDLLVAGGSAGIFAAERRPSEVAWASSRNLAPPHERARRDGVGSPTSSRSGAANVRWLGKVSDDDLALLLSRALCLAFPSFTEGFGLPIVEAMALGCPVVSSDRASMPEVCGDAALMASPDDPAAWLAHVAALASSEGLRDDLRGRGRRQAERFSWADTAQGYLDLFDGAP